MGADDYSVSSSVQERTDDDLFISYSRRDKDFVRQLWSALTQVKQKAWVDWNDIPPAQDWRQEIYQGIEAANNFVFIISSHSTSSMVCGEELDHAIKHGKRLVPIVREDVGYDKVHSELARLNWIFFREEDDFDGAFTKLIEAIETDLSYVRAHTRLLVRAREWENTERDSSFLLRGSDLEAAEQWLAHSSIDPKPTALHQEYINASRIAETERQEVELRLRRMTPQQYRNRQALLNKVNSYWVKGVLENSLHNRALMALGLEERPNAVSHPWNMTLEELDQLERTIPQGTRIIAIFDQLGEGRTLLILGEPGAGKTTTLLELTRDLIHRAEQGIDYRIPVVFNLSSWAVKKQTIAEWLVEELNTKYQVPKQIGQTWVKEQQLLLLLDGLDEVPAESRDACVAAINAFQQEQGCEMVVTSRIKDYEALSNRLNFQSAIFVRSLTQEQVRQYLDSAGSDLTGLRALIERDAALQELASSPLMLNIMTLAYQGVAVEDLPKTDLVEEHRKQLFDAYIERMFKRRGAENRYSRAQAMRWLIWLAQRMVQESQTVFLIERMQPIWLQTKPQIIIYIIGSLLTIYISPGLILWLWLSLLKQPNYWLMIWLVFAAQDMVKSGFFRARIPTVKPVEVLKWSGKAVISDMLTRKRVYILLLGSFLLQFLINSLTYKDFVTALYYIVGLIVVFIGGTAVSVGLKDSLEGTEIETKTIPNEGIWRSARNAWIYGLISILVAVPTFYFYVNNQFYVNNHMNMLSPQNIVLIIPVFTLISSLIQGGGKACIQHFTLRLILYHKGFIPWNYARFLNYATERIFLQKVGGGYIFIHRLLLEHFAHMELEQGRR